ncbi:transposase [Xenorhabdus vietnamensis]|uniref:Transposase n=1 Tax=Xenorhabdus vietnamensis TaxID=351656 RepID=A0A1Y2SBN2_9GAMM|nr:transposase [Xenorhabdus vietnamensis]
MFLAQTLKRLIALLAPFNIVIYMTEGWRAYEKTLTGKLHVVSKRYTQRIERHNLNLRLLSKPDLFQSPLECMTKSLGII